VSYSGTATGQHAGLKVSLKRTLTANGQGLFGTYTMKLGKQTLDKGTFFLLPP